MKKLLSLLICVLLLAATAVTVYADSPIYMHIQAQSGTVQPGDTVTFTVRVDTVENCRSGGIVLSYDANIFEFVSGECLVSDAVMSDFTGGTGVFAFSEGQTLSGDIFRFHLRMKASAAYGSYTVSGSANIRTGEGSIAPYVSGATLSYSCSHTYGNWASQDGGSHRRSCSQCGSTETAQHSWDGGKVTKDPSCKEEGQMAYTCTDCGAAKSEPIAKTDSHVYSAWVNADGSTHRQSCTICGLEKTASHSWDNGKMTDAPSCKEEGRITYTCTDCGAEKSEAVAKTDSHVYGSWVNADGSTHRQSCTICGLEMTASHNWDGGKVTKDPSCKEEGRMTYTCTDCGAEKSEPIAKTDSHGYDHDCDTDCNVCGITREIAHTYGTKWVSDASSHYHVCAICGAKETAAAHTPGKEATESTAQTCTVCGYVIRAALGHTHSYAGTLSCDEAGHWYACSCGVKDVAAHRFDNGCDASCDACGYTRRTFHDTDADWNADAESHWHTCAVCGEVPDAAAHIPGPKATEDAAQVCTVCGYEIAPRLEPAAAESQPATEVTEEPEETESTEAAEPEDTAVKDTARFPWWPLAIALALLAIGAVLLLLRRK